MILQKMQAAMLLTVDYAMMRLEQFRVMAVNEVHRWKFRIYPTYALLEEHLAMKSSQIVESLLRHGSALNSHMCSCYDETPLGGWRRC